MEIRYVNRSTGIIRSEQSIRQCGQIYVHTTLWTNAHTCTRNYIDITLGGGPTGFPEDSIRRPMASSGFVVTQRSLLGRAYAYVLCTEVILYSRIRIHCSLCRCQASIDLTPSQVVYLVRNGYKPRSVRRPNWDSIGGIAITDCDPLSQYLHCKCFEQWPFGLRRRYYNRHEIFTSWAEFLAVVLHSEKLVVTNQLGDRGLTIPHVNKP